MAITPLQPNQLDPSIVTQDELYAAIGSGTPTDLNPFIATFAASISSGQAYAEPTTANVTSFMTGLYDVMRGAISSTALTALGFTVTTGYESVTGRKYALIVNEYGTSRAWGAYLIDLTQPVKQLIECPHPVYDSNTEVMTLELWRRLPGSLLMLAGAHRTAPAATNLADVAHQTGSLFHQVAAELSSYGLPQLQIHGFADASEPNFDVIVSSGDANENEAIKRLAKQIEATGLRVGRNWDATATTLTGTTNTQGDLALANGTVFIHIENNNTLRTSSALLTKWYGALATTSVTDTIAQSRPLRAKGVSGQFPSSVGSVNSAGTSQYVARADHGHRLTSNTPANNDTVMRVSGAWQSQTPTQAKTILGLENVDNTSDATKNASTRTLTNARITPRTSYPSSVAIQNINADTVDMVAINAQGIDVSFPAPTGTPTDGQTLLIRLKDNGTSRAIVWNVIWRGRGVTLPTATVANKWLYIGALWNVYDSKWDVISVVQET